MKRERLNYMWKRIENETIYSLILPNQDNADRNKNRLKNVHGISSTYAASFTGLRQHFISNIMREEGMVY